MQLHELKCRECGKFRASVEHSDSGRCASCESYFEASKLGCLILLFIIAVVAGLTIIEMGEDSGILHAHSSEER